MSSSPKPAPASGSFLASTRAAMRSWRTASVAILSFSSGLPLGLVWIAIPDWMRSAGVDIRLVGLFTLAQAPWSFKILWAPLMDRYVPPRLGRRRGWAALAQIGLLLLTVALAGVGDRPETPWVALALTLAVALASATQDIALDAYAVDVLRPEEHGVAVGARTALYRAAMFVAGGLAISAAAVASWPAVCVGLALLYLPMLWVTWKAPEPETEIRPPATLREAVWLPFLGFLARHRAVEILAFVVLYKLADSLSQSLLRPFLIDMGYGPNDRGLWLATLGTACTLVGTFLGGAVTPTLGLGNSLWIFGLLQIFSNVGYILVANTGVNRPLMFGAMGFEMFTTGLGMGAFSVLLLRMTQKRFSATQYALFSSLFGIPRILAGPVTGGIVHAVGWSTFFVITMVAGIPGLVLLARFVPPGVREPRFEVRPPSPLPPLGAGALAARGIAGFAVGGMLSGLVAWGVEMLRTRVAPGGAWHPAGALRRIAVPDDAAGCIVPAGVALAAIVCGLFTAAVSAARRRGEDAPS